MQSIQKIKITVPGQTIKAAMPPPSSALQKTQSIVKAYDDMGEKLQQFGKAALGTSSSPRCVSREEIIKEAAEIGYRISGTFSNAVKTAYQTYRNQLQVNMQIVHEVLNLSPGKRIIFDEELCEQLSKYAPVSSQLFENAEKFEEIGSQIKEKEGESITEEDYRSAEEKLVALHAKNAELMKTIEMSYKNTDMGLKSHFVTRLGPLTLHSVLS